MSSVPSRTVHEADALRWLVEHPLPSGASIATSLPSFDEFSHRDPVRWRDWFVDAAALVLRSTPQGSAAVFFQTDVRLEPAQGGGWIDKAFLVQLAAERERATLRWHKLALRAPAGIATGGRPGYAHLLCFAPAGGRALRDDATADVLPQLGEMPWTRAVGVDVARFVVAWLKDHSGAHTIVDPFCGVGTFLAAANAAGLDAIGVEKNPGRCEKARALVL